MSEPSSLVVRAHLPPEAYERFLASLVAPVHHFNDWQQINAKFDMAWLEKIHYEPMLHVRDWLHGFTRPPKDWPKELQMFAIANTHVVYDSKQQCLHIDVLEFSENLIEYVEALNVLRQLAHFKETPNSDDFILIYPYLWNNTSGYIDVGIELSAGHSRILDKKTDAAQISHYRTLADAALSERVKSLVPPDQDM